MRAYGHVISDCCNNCRPTAYNLYKYIVNPANPILWTPVPQLEGKKAKKKLEKRNLETYRIPFSHPGNTYITLAVCMLFILGTSYKATDALVARYITGMATLLREYFPVIICQEAPDPPPSYRVLKYSMPVDVITLIAFGSWHAVSGWTLAVHNYIYNIYIIYIFIDIYRGLNFNTHSRIRTL